MAENRITSGERTASPSMGRGQVEHIGDVLAELLAQYEARFPGVHITVVDDAVAA